MIIVLMVILLVVSVLIYILNEDKWLSDFVAAVSIITCMISAIAILIMLAILAINYTNADADKAAFEKHYESLIYQFENGIYDNDNDVGKKELYDQITKWNYDLARRKILSKNLWVGVFYPDIYDSFQFIELE